MNKSVNTFKCRVQGCGIKVRKSMDTITYPGILYCNPKHSSIFLPPEILN